MKNIKIWYFTPYSLEKAIGKAYNEYCKIVPKDDWICLMDGDAMFLQSNFGHIILDYINTYPECLLFLPVTNRVKKKAQCYKQNHSSDPNLVTHKKISNKLSVKRTINDLSKLEYPTMPCFIFSKKTWESVGGFDERSTILGVDWRFSKKVIEQGPCYRMNGLYLLHYYRLIEGIKSTKHIL